MFIPSGNLFSYYQLTEILIMYVIFQALKFQKLDPIFKNVFWRSYIYSGHINTAIWMHYMDANKTAGEETRWQITQECCVQSWTSPGSNTHKTPTVRPPAPITKTIQVRRTRHAGHCWRSRDELIRDVLLWIPTHGRAKAGRPARTYIQQLCEDTGCCPEDLPRAMNDREEWRERVRDIRAASTIWWWWYIYIYMCVCVCVCVY